MTKLRISESLSLPLDFVTQTQAILAKKRVGKSYTAAVQAEELLKAGQQIVAIDPTGAWWGLKSSADGKHAGFPIAIFGGEHGDVPLEEGAGEVIARAIVEQRFSAIIDLTLFRKGQINRFMAPFLETLYRLNREAMHLFVDEADAIAPQKPFGEEARMLGAMEDLVRRGGIRGIGCTMITQRPAVLNKNVLTQAEILCALRIVHHKDIAAIREWVEVHADPDLADEMIASLPALPIGTAWFWSPGWGDIFEKVKIRQRETFDSGATPKAGEVKRTPKVMADVDLKKLGEQVQATIQRQKENDPAELKRTIAKLQQEMTKKQVSVPGATKEVKVVDPAAIARAIGKRDGEWMAAAKAFQKEIRDAVNIFAKTISNSDLRTPALDKAAFAQSVQTVQTVQRPNPAISAVNRPTFTAPAHRGVTNSDNGDLSRPQLALITALAEAEAIGRPSISRSWLAFMASVSSKSSGFEKNVSTLRTKGLIDYPTPNAVCFTEQGRKLAPGISSPMSAEELFDRVRRMVSGPQSALLEVLRNVWPKPLSREDLAERANVSSLSSGFEKNVSTLASRDLAEYPQKGMVKLQNWVMLQELAA